MSSPRKNSQSTKPLNIVKAAGMLFGNLTHVTFDPAIDCPPHACYNCWSPDHQIKDCRAPRTREYCCNCGRKDVRVYECARCSRAFRELDWDLRSWINYTFLSSRKRKDDETTCQSFHSCDEKLTVTADDDGSRKFGVYTEPNDLFAFMRAKRIREVEFSEDAVNLDDTRMAGRDSFGENSVVSVEDNKDAGRNESSMPSGEPIREFLNLLEAVKHLSVGTQEVVVLQLMAELKKGDEGQGEDKTKKS